MDEIFHKTSESLILGVLSEKEVEEIVTKAPIGLDNQ